MSNLPANELKLHYICCSNNPNALEIVRKHLSNGGNPRIRDQEGLTPLHAAAAYDNVAICQLLLHFGADAFAKDDQGRTPVTIATGNAKLFLKRYVENDRKTRRGLLRRIFVCLNPKQSKFLRKVPDKVRQSFGSSKKKSLESTTELATEVSFQKTPRRARTPDVIERTPVRQAAKPHPKTPDFVTSSTVPIEQKSVLLITPKRIRLPPRKMVTPTAPSLTPKPISPVNRLYPVLDRSTSPKKPLPKVSMETSYETAQEESFDAVGLENRLSQLKISTPDNSKNVDESKLRRIRRLKDTELRIELRKVGIAAGPICSRTRRMYEKKLLFAQEGREDVVSAALKYSRQLEQAFSGKIDLTIGQELDEKVRIEFANSGVTAFVYLLIDPRVLGDEKKPSLKQLVSAIFYVGKGTKARPLAHLIDAKKLRVENSPKLGTTAKFKRIDDIWNSGNGVGLLEISHTISDKEAFIREAAFIEAIRLENLSNVKGGEWHGDTRSWDLVARATLGVYLLEQAKTILHTFSVRQVYPQDLPDSLYPHVTTRRR